MSSPLAKIPSVNKLLDDTAHLQQKIDQHYLKRLIDNFITSLKQEPEKYKLTEMNREQIAGLIVAHTEAEVAKLTAPSMRRVINATGVILHTGLGRAPLGNEVIQQLKTLAGYTNLEIELRSGRRGERLEHPAPLLRLLTGSEDAVVVNNNAAAVLLILNSIARRKEVIVSRGELVEIGGSFRMPEVMKSSGSKMVEIGATNKTHLHDYAEAINEKTAAVMLVHPSNFKIIGFTQKPELKDVIDLAHQHNLPVIFDLGSGALVDMQQFGLEYEPVVSAMIHAGIDIISFSGDKLLGGPQSGIIVGSSKWLKIIRRNHLLRALRCDKLTLHLLTSILQRYLHHETLLKENKTLSLFRRDLKRLKKLSEKLKAMVNDKPDITYQIVPAKGKVGSGAYPVTQIDSIALKITGSKMSADTLARALRLHDVPIFGYIEGDSYYLNMLTLSEDDLPEIARTLNNSI